ncbi:MAG TPA: SbcC/MukB-like Walker B domain-containing protein, partial [Actinomycetota bacterium]|nr:SbcC/MukB-like Walker B domain-containing protein [Actinomycetota bacterium]
LVRREPPALDAARARERAADEAHEEARAAAARAGDELGRACAELEHCVAGAARVAERVHAGRAELEALLGDVGDFATEADARIARLADAVRRCADASKAADAARAEEHRHAGRRERVATRERRIAAALVAIAAEAKLEPPEIDADATELARHARRTNAALEDARATAARDRDAAEDRAAVALAALDDLRRSLELDGDASVDAALAAARASEAHARSAVEELAAQIERRRELTAAAGRLRARADVLRRIVDDLRDTNFVAFLLEDRRRLLSELGSQSLRAMTERYRFSDDAEFDVVDELDGDRRRDVQTLSGGETFLASLALALALAEAVSREGGRLESLFLDEGFGSLDADAFDHALDGIERIVTTDRLIGLVSHVPALAQRVEDRIELAKSDEGLTEIVAGAIA